MYKDRDEDSREDQGVRPRRRCEKYVPNSFFLPYERVNRKIISNYERTSEDNLIESLSLFIKMCREGQSMERNDFKSESLQKSKRLEEYSQPRALQMEKDKKYEGHTPEEMVYEAIRKVKDRQPLCVTERINEQKMRLLKEMTHEQSCAKNRATEKMIQSMKKLSLSTLENSNDVFGDLVGEATTLNEESGVEQKNECKQLTNEVEKELTDTMASTQNAFQKKEPLPPSSLNERQSQVSNLLESQKTYDETEAFDETKNKPISLLLQESLDRKAKDQMQRLNKINYTEWEDSDSDCEYQISDRDSDVDSEGDYREIYRQEDFVVQSKNGPGTLFGEMKMFKPGTFVTGKNFVQSKEEKEVQDAKKMFESKLPSVKPLNFQSLLHSPKKTNTKQKRRLYINKKRVPRWAEDLKKVGEVVSEQRKDPFRYLKEFGHAQIEMVNANVFVEGLNVRPRRQSTAKWKRSPEEEKYQPIFTDFSSSARKKQPDELEI